MQFVISILIILFALGLGLYFLFIEPTPALGVHFLLLGLYFFVSLNEMKGQPFHKSIYYLLSVMLLLDGIYFLFFFSTKYLLSGIISLFFAYSTWNAIKRVS